jgi:hypothetical protein
MKLYPDDWRERLTTGGVVAVCMLAAIFLGPLVGINGFWIGMLAITVAIIVGNLLGQQVCRLLFGPSTGRPPE